MHGFTSYYWDVDDLNEDGQRAWAKVDDPDDVNDLLTGFRALLGSADITAWGIALDQFFYAQTQGRWGLDNPLSALKDEIAARAREMLATVPDADRDWSVVRSAWASALAVLMHLGAPTDLPRILDVLDTSVASGDHDEFVSVVEGVFLAMHGCLRDADDAALRQTGARLARVFTNESLPVDLRESAIQPFSRNRRTASAMGQEPALVALLHHPELALSAQAAMALVNRDPYDALVRQAAAGWPKDTPGTAAGMVRALIREADNLVRARATLATANSSRTELIRAAYELRDQGDTTDIDPLMAAWNTDPTDSGLAEAVSQALRRCLEEADTATCQRIGAQLAALFADENLPTDVRVAAIDPFLTGRLGQEDNLAKLLRHNELKLATEAAWVLVGTERYRPLVREAAATWTADAPGPAAYVREELEAN